MIDKIRIEKGLYWDEAWSLVSGCTPVSEGCANCIAIMHEGKHDFCLRCWRLWLGED